MTFVNHAGVATFGTVAKLLVTLSDTSPAVSVTAAATSAATSPVMLTVPSSLS